MMDRSLFLAGDRALAGSFGGTSNIGIEGVSLAGVGVSLGATPVGPASGGALTDLCPCLGVPPPAGDATHVVP